MCLKAKRVQTLHGQSGCWQEMRWGNQKQTALQIKSRPTPVKPRHSQPGQEEIEREQEREKEREFG